jgi:hypothetical protein
LSQMEGQDGASAELCLDCRFEGPSEMGEESLPALLSVIREKDAEIECLEKCCDRRLIELEKAKRAEQFWREHHGNANLDIERLHRRIATMAAALRWLKDNRECLCNDGATNCSCGWADNWRRIHAALRDAGMEE